MALYMKQDFTPPVLSPKWFAMKLRPNMLIYSHEQIYMILGSGLISREDSIEVEKEIPADGKLEGEGGVWLTSGEFAAGVAAVAVCVAVFPPKSVNLFHLAAYMSLPVAIRIAHRRVCKGTLSALLAVMRGYLRLVRRASACLLECFNQKIVCVRYVDKDVLASALVMLCRQQSELAGVMSQASSELMGNKTYLQSDGALYTVGSEDSYDFVTIHKAFVVVQSTFLKHIAMAHFIPSPQARDQYNDKIYFIHHVLIRDIKYAFTQYYVALERLCRRLKIDETGYSFQR